MRKTPATGRSTGPTLVMTAAAFALVFCQSAIAKVPQDEADKLKNGTLTPMGAEPGANAAGSIPKFEGGLTKGPSSYKGIVDGKQTRYTDPFPQDKAKFTITKANVDQYKGNLSPGQLAMFSKYPDYKMEVYETRRTGAFPDYVYEWNHKNALNAELTNDGNGFAGAAVGVPFPIPKTGPEPVWNHKSRFRGVSIRRWNDQLPVTATGDYTLATLQEDILFRYNNPEVTPDSVNNLLAYFLQIRHAPSRLRGEVLLVHETLDQVAEVRRAWLYNPGQRRVRRAPNVGHDNPGTASDGLRTNDQFDMFNGDLGRYTWKLVGKQELYIPYNSYKIHDDKYSYADITQKGHLNQDLARYELHRVWVVDATLRDGTSHIYKRRVFYIDEDTWQAAVIDCYDTRDQLWRMQEAHTFMAYDKPYLAPAVESVNDLQSGRYLLMAMNNEKDEMDDRLEFDDNYFTTSNMKNLAPK